MIRQDIAVGEGVVDGINERMAQEQAAEENRDPIGGGAIAKEKIGLHDGKVVYVKGTEGDTIGVRVEKRNDGKYELVAEEDGKTKCIAVDDYEGEIYSTAPRANEANADVFKSEERGLEDEADSEGGKILDVADAVDKPDTGVVETERAQEEIAAGNVGEERGQEPMSTTEGETPESQRVSNPRENPTAEENVHKAVSFAQRVAERLGYRVEVITGDANMNGFISFKDGVIHINKDRIGNRDTTFQHTQSDGWVIGHELYHAIAKALGRESRQLLAFEQACIRMASMTEGFRKYYADMYASYVTDLMRTKGMTLEQAKEAVKNDGFLNEEIAGDFVGKLLESERMQENFFRELENTKDRTMVGEIMHGIKNAAISFKNSLSDIALALKGDERGVFERQKADVFGRSFAGLIDRIETFGAKKSEEREYLDWAMERSKGDAEATAKFLDLMLGGAEKNLKEWEKKRDREVGKAFKMEREEATKFLDALYAERDKIVAKVETIQKAKALLEQERKNKELSADMEALAQKSRREAEASLRVGDSPFQVGRVIVDRWNAAKKLVCDFVDSVTMAGSGEEIEGRWMIVEAGKSATASHDYKNNFAKSEGFPRNERGDTVNDRNYETDKNAQGIVQKMGSDFDGRGLKDVIVVSPDGVVLSGNNRWMSRDIAAVRGTDVKYVEKLYREARKYGFTREQLDGFEHPTLVFVTNERVAYNTETFAKFNAEDKKTMTAIDDAKSFARKLSAPEHFGYVIRRIKDAGSLKKFFESESDVKMGVLNFLEQIGVITATDKAKFLEDTGSANFSKTGEELFRNMLIGRAFVNEPELVRMATTTEGVARAVSEAIVELARNNDLGEGYSLGDITMRAIREACEVKRTRGENARIGMRISDALQQTRIGENGEMINAGAHDVVVG